MILFCGRDDGIFILKKTSTSKKSYTLLCTMKEYILTCRYVSVSVEIGAPPPVPPRRRKHKSDVASIKPIVTPRTIKKEHDPVMRAAGTRPQRKSRPLPPPLPPCPSPIPRSVPGDRKSQYINNKCSAILQNSEANNEKMKNGHVISNARPIVNVLDDTKTSPRFLVTEVMAIEKSAKMNIESVPSNLRADENSEYRNENGSGRSSPLPSNYPSLLFTLEDFQSVMGNSGISDRSINAQYDSIIASDTSGDPTSITSFIDNSLVDELEEESEEVYFRVTTTNVPFEKCLSGWSVSIDSKEFNSNFDETDHFIFEDYIDRSRRLNARPAAAAFLFDDDTFDNFAKDDADGVESNPRTATKVRFVIESPSESTSEVDNFDDTLENLGKIETIIIDDRNLNENQCTSIIITEITDTNEGVELSGRSHEFSSSDNFGDTPLLSLLTSRTDRNIDFVSNRNINPDLSLSMVPVSTIISNKEEVTSDVSFLTDEEPEIRNIEGHPVPRRNAPSPRFTIPKRHDFDMIPNVDDEPLPELPITYDPRDESFVRKNWNAHIDLVPNDQAPLDNTLLKSAFSSEASKTAREAFVTGKLKLDSSDNFLNNSMDENATIGKQRTEEKKKIFIDSVLRDFIDNDDIEWHDSSDEDEYEDKHDTTQGVQKSESLNDINVLNRVTCLPEGVPGDKPSRSPTASITNQRYNQKVSLNKGDEVKDIPESPVSARAQCVINTSTLSLENKDDTNWVPMNVRRNSFLENMLTENDSRKSLERNVPCSIIAAHPKPAAPQVQNRSPVSNVRQKEAEEATNLFQDVNMCRETAVIGIVRSGSNESSPKQLRNKTGVRIVGPKPAARESIASGGEKEKKSTGEAKSDVLSELLCNFSAIKLKSVEPYKREIDRWEEVDDKPVIQREIGNKEKKVEIRIAEGIKTENATGSTDSGSTGIVTKTAVRLDIDSSSLMDSSNRVSEKTDDYNSCRIIINEKSTVENYVVLQHQDDGAKSINLDTSIIKMVEDEQIITVDKCAIARTSNNVIRRNNNDNNAMTPVAVSNDQKSCDADVTIAPGSVKNFVELYEIQHEQTSKNSKSNYSDPVAKRLSMSCDKGSPNNTEDDASEGLEDKTVEKPEGAEGNENKVDEAKAHARSQTIVHRPCVDRFDSHENDAWMNAITRNIDVQNDNASHARDGFSSTNSSLYVPNQSQQVPGFGPIAAKRRTQESCLKITTELSPRSESKKTVTFFSDHAMEKSRDNPSNQVLSIDSTIRDGDPRPKIKRRAPGRPEARREIDCSATKSIIENDFGSNPSLFGTLCSNKKVSPTPAPRSDANSTQSAALIRYQVSTRAI